MSISEVCQCLCLSWQRVCRRKWKRRQQTTHASSADKVDSLSEQLTKAVLRQRPILKLIRGEVKCLRSIKTGSFNSVTLSLSGPPNEITIHCSGRMVARELAPPLQRVKCHQRHRFCAPATPFNLVKNFFGAGRTQKLWPRRACEIARKDVVCHSRRSL